MVWSPSMSTSGSMIGTSPASWQSAAYRAGDDPLGGEHLREWDAVGRGLTDGLVEQDHAADELGRTRGGEEHLAVGAAAVLGGLDADALEPLLDRAGALVGREDPFARRHQSPRRRFHGG